MNIPRPHSTPRLVITEQPKQRGMRFRYLCEGRSAGSIPGENTTSERKTWPAVQIQNYHGEVTIRVSLVSNDKIPRPHPHSLVGKDCSDGICTVRVTPETQMTATFSNLGVQCVKRKEVTEALRTRQRLQVDPYNSAQSNQQTTDIDLNVVLLCFEAFINQGDYHYVIQPVLSNPIYDKKATGSALLRICRVDRSFGSCKGGDEVYLLCDKVQKDDITICFYDVDGWEAYGEFSPTDVHRQVAIVFRTPAYKDQNIHQATKVLFQLRRGSDHETSESKEFTYLPSHHVQPSLGRTGKRKFADHTIKEQLGERIKTRVRMAQQPVDPFHPIHHVHSSIPWSQAQSPFPGMSNYQPGFLQSRLIGPPQVQPSASSSHLHDARSTQVPSVMSIPPTMDWRMPPSITPQPVMSPYAASSPLMGLPNFQPAMTSQNQVMNMDGYEALDSSASFKDIDTEGIKASIEQLSIEPIEPQPMPPVKTEQVAPSHFPSRNPSEETVTSPLGTGMYTNFDVAATSPESYHVQSPPGAYSQQLQSTVVPMPQPGMNSNTGYLNSLNVDQTDRLPSFDLTQQLPSAPYEEDFLGSRPGGN